MQSWADEGMILSALCVPAGLCLADTDSCRYLGSIFLPPNGVDELLSQLSFFQVQCGLFFLRIKSLEEVSTDFS